MCTCVYAFMCVSVCICKYILLFCYNILHFQDKTQFQNTTNPVSVPVLSFNPGSCLMLITVSVLLCDVNYCICVAMEQSVPVVSTVWGFQPLHLVLEEGGQEVITETANTLTSLCVLLLYLSSSPRNSNSICNKQTWWMHRSSTLKPCQSRMVGSIFSMGAFPQAQSSITLYLSYAQKLQFLFTFQLYLVLIREHYNSPKCFLQKNTVTEGYEKKHTIIVG